MNHQDHSSRWIRVACALAGVFAMLVSAAGAVAIGNSNIQIAGFFSQGWLYNSENNHPTRNDGGTWDFREMALNASTPIGSHLRVGGQVFAQRFGSIGEDKVILDWAVADYNFTPAFGIRVGRVKYPKGLYGEALDLDVVRPFVFLPAAVYSPILRDFSASFDGAMIYGALSSAAGSFDYKLFHGDIPMSKEKGVAEFYNNSGLYSASGGGVQSLNMDSVTGGQLAWTTPISGLKAVYSYSYYTNLSTDGPFAAAPMFNLHSNFKKFAWTTYSVEYVRNAWTFAAEWQRSRGGLAYAAAPVLATVNDHSGWDGWYGSVARRLNDKFEVGGYYGSLENNATTTSHSDPRVHQRDTALSFRYDVNEHLLFKIEAHHIDGTYQTFNTARIPNPSGTTATKSTLIAIKTTLSF
ncbi:MAG: hypothetical protein ABIZ04_04835 [Opitutus sp.]